MEVTFGHRIMVLEKQVEKIESNMQDTCTKCMLLEENHEQTKEKMSSMEKHTNEIIKIGYEVQNINSKLDTISNMIHKQNSRMDEQDSKIDCLQDRPGKAAIQMWVFVASAIGTSILGVVIGYFIK